MRCDIPSAIEYFHPNGFSAALTTAGAVGNHHAFTIAACTWKSNGFSPVTCSSQ